MRRAFNIICTVILLLLNTFPANAGRSVSGITITTKVLPAIKYEIMHQEKNLLITDENIRLGYIDVSDAVIFSVMSNSKNGYVLTFFIGEGLFKGVEVFYDSLTAEIHDTNNEIHMPPGGMKHAVKELSFRFYLSDMLMPGMYDWPVALMIQAM